jgi:hypothetical protein
MTWAGDTVTRVVERFYLGRIPHPPMSRSRTRLL